MLAYGRLSLLLGLRSPAVWLLAGLGPAGAALGLGLAVLALRDDAVADQALVAETVCGVAAAAALWVIAHTLADDRTSGFSLAADQTRAGHVQRLLGRWAGAPAVGVVAAAPTAVAGALLAGWIDISLLYASIGAAALMGGWALVLSVLGVGAAPCLLAGAGLWAAGHLPWGAPGWGLAGAGAHLGALLPHATFEVRASASALAAAVALVALGVLLAGRRPAGR